MEQNAHPFFYAGADYRRYGARGVNPSRWFIGVGREGRFALLFS